MNHISPITYKVLSVLIAATLLLTLASTGPFSTSAPSVLAAGRVPTSLQDYVRWFGSQHSHTAMDGDDGAGTAAQAFAYVKNLPHLQYYIISPHVHQSRSGSATLWSESTYDTIRASATSATTANFVAIAGQEISTISSGGHWNLYNANDLIDTGHPDGDWNDSDDYYDHVAGLGTAGQEIAAQFNHPNSTDFGSRYDAAAAPYFGTFVVSSGPTSSTAQDFSANGSNGSYESLWATQLGRGWKVSPSADQDNHNPNWGAQSTEYTVIVRPKGATLNASNVLKGLREHMTYATEDANMQIGFIANGWSMGQTIGGSATVAFTIWWNNPSASICNNNVPACKTEQASDVVQNIWIYKNSFSTVVASYSPNTTSGAWNVSVPATTGDRFIVKFKDKYTLAASGRTTDLTWSAPVWYDPAHADAQLLVDDGGSTSTPTPTATTVGPTPTPTTIPPTNTPIPPTSTATPGGSGCSVVKINEILPAASVVYSSDWVELYNPTASTVTIGGCIIDDPIGSGGAAYTISAGTTIAPYGFWAVDIANVFNNAGDTVNFIASNGTTVIDTYTFGNTAYDVSWYRLPDGGAWQTTTTSSPTKGASNGGAAPTPTNTPIPPTATKTPTSLPPTNTPTKTPTPISPTNTPVPPTATPIPGGEKIVNGGFESGTSPWVQYSSGGYQLIDTTLPHTGSYGVYFGNYNNANEYIYQTVTIPSNGTLTYWWYMTTQESGSTAYDYMYVRLYNTSGGLVATLRTRSNTASKNAWYQDSLSLSSYAGQTLRVQFAATTDSSLPTAFFVDDVSVK